MIYEHQSLRRGLVGAWCPSLRTGGYTLEDRGERRNNGTLFNGATWSSGALSLTAASKHYAHILDTAKSNALLAGPLSVTAWIRPTSVSGTQEIVAAYTGSSSGLFLLEVGRTAGKISFLQNGGSVTATSAASVSANQWSFVGFTRDGGAGAWNLRLVIGGVVESFTTVQNPNAQPGMITTIGRAGSQDILYYGGLIDDVRIWDRALTESEISVLRTRPGIGLVPRRQRRVKSGSTLNLNVSGTWKATTPWVNVGGVWKKATAYTRQGGTWK